MKSQLLNLIKMELMSIKKDVFMLFLIPALYPALLRSRSNLDFISYLFCIGIIGLLLFTNFAESDEKYKTGIMLNTFPVRRSEIINARFLSMGIIYTATTIIYILSAAILHSVKPETYGLFNLSAIPIGLLLVSIINFIQVPLYYIFDVQKSRVLGIVIVFGAIMLFSYLSSQRSWTKNLFEYFTKMNPAFIDCLLLIIAIIASIITCLISQKVYERKEF